MQVREIMTERVACCTPQSSLQDVAKMMDENDCGEIPVVEDEQSRKLVGVVTDRDIAIRTVAKSKNPLELTAGDCMSSPVTTVTPETDVDTCCKTMEERQIRRVPVTDDGGGCCGMVSQADVARKGTEYETAEVVRDVSQPTHRAHA